jgi:hypothetical protein
MHLMYFDYLHPLHYLFLSPTLLLPDLGYQIGVQKVLGLIRQRKYSRIDTEET